MELNRSVLVAPLHSLFLASTMVMAVGCIEPIEPGSDLPDDAGPELIGPVLRVNLEGKYNLTTSLPAEDGGEGMMLNLTLELTQNGEDNSTDTSTLEGKISLFSLAEADSMGMVALNKYGYFEMPFETLTIQGALIGMEEDMNLDITLRESQAMEGGDCIYGMFAFPVMTMGFNVVVESTYTARREGSTGECTHPDDVEEAQSGETGDMES